MLAVIGGFMVVAACATLVPSFVHDRVPTQFVPVWTFLTEPICGDAPNESVVWALACASQWIIGLSEAAIGASLLAGAFVPRRRRALASFGLAYASGLFGVFLVTMFAMHDKSLPSWNQYPAILAWISVTWLVVASAE